MWAAFIIIYFYYLLYLILCPDAVILWRVICDRWKNVQCRTMQINTNQNSEIDPKFLCIPINVDQCRIKQHWSTLRSIEKGWLALWSIAQLLSVLAIDRESLDNITLNYQNAVSVVKMYCWFVRLFSVTKRVQEFLTTHGDNFRLRYIIPIISSPTYVMTSHLFKGFRKPQKKMRNSPNG